MANDAATVDSRLKSALKSVCVDVARLRYTGKASPFITFQIVMGSEVDHSDDDPGGTEYIYRFDVYSKTDYTQLVKDAVKAVRGAGFHGVSFDPEAYEEDTGFYHQPVQIKYVETENGEE